MLRKIYANLEILKKRDDQFAIKTMERLKLIVAGGDGTAGWLLGVVCDLKLSHPPPIATVPLGTGNNLPFAFGWGKRNPGTDQPSVEAFLDQVMKAKEMKIDNWHILMRIRAPKEGSCDPIPPLELPHSLHYFHRVSESDELNRIRVRHECRTHWLEKANERLTKVQKERIGGTPFKDLMSFTENNNFKISGDLLKELALRWDERRGGFRVGSKILSFTPLDVCLTLGLRIVGEEIKCENEGNENENICIGKLDPLDIFQEFYYLTDDSDVDKFCRLYLRLGFAEFYFPNSKKHQREVNGPWFKLLDDLNSLHKYSWGVAVYHYLVRGLTDASDKLVNETVTGQTHITGCAAVLQVWAFEHVFLRMATVSTLTFPRVLKWCGVSLANSNLSRSFRHNLTVDELSATEEELKNDAVREALQFAPNGYVNWSQGIVNASLKQILDQNEALRQENVRMDARITAVCEAFEDLKTRYAGQKSDSCSVDDKKEDFTEEVHQMPPNSEVDTGVVNETKKAEDNEPLQVVVWGQSEVPMDAENTDGETSNMYIRLKRSPRKRTTSDAMRSPYVEPKRKTRKK